MNLLKVTIVFLVVCNLITGFYVVEAVREMKDVLRGKAWLEKENAQMKKGLLNCDQALGQTNKLLENRTVLLKLHPEK